MSNGNGDSGDPGLIEVVKSIGQDAADLADILSRRAAADADLTKRERTAIETLIARSQSAMTEASALAKERRREQIGELEKLIKSLESAIANLGSQPEARRELQALKRSKRAQLVGLLTRESMDFGGILTVTQVERIRDVLTRAKRDVARRKKAAAFLSTLMEVADLSVSIVGKLVAVP